MAEKLYGVLLPYWVDVVVGSIVQRVIKGKLIIKVKAKNTSLAIEQAIANVGTQTIDGYPLLPYRFIDTGRKAGENYWWVLTDDFYCVIRASSNNEARRKIIKQNLIVRQIEKIKTLELLLIPKQPSLFPNKSIVKPQYKHQWAGSSSSSLGWKCEVCGETNSGLVQQCECGAFKINPFADTPKPSKSSITTSK